MISLAQLRCAPVQVKQLAAEVVGHLRENGAAQGDWGAHATVLIRAVLPVCQYEHLALLPHP